MAHEDEPFLAQWHTPPRYTVRSRRARREHLPPRPLSSANTLNDNCSRPSSASSSTVSVICPRLYFFLSAPWSTFRRPSQARRPGLCYVSPTVIVLVSSYWVHIKHRHCMLAYVVAAGICPGGGPVRGARTRRSCPFASVRRSHVCLFCFNETLCLRPRRRSIFTRRGEQPALWERCKRCPPSCEIVPQRPDSVL